MVMVDYDYPFKELDDEEPPPFEPDRIFYASDLEKNTWEVRLPVQALGQQAMIIYIDIYGNEYREIKTPSPIIQYIAPSLDRQIPLELSGR